MQLHLAKLLLVIMTLTGVFMPMHAYAHELADSGSHHQIGTDNHHDDKGKSHGCDHCCHFPSHSLGLIRVTAVPVAPSMNHCSASPDSQYASLNHAPPYHPPIT